MQFSDYLAAVALITALVPSLLQLFKYRAEGRSQNANADKVISDTALGMIDPLKRQNSDLRAENNILLGTLEKLNGELSRLKERAEVVQAVNIQVTSDLANKTKENGRLKDELRACKEGRIVRRDDTLVRR